MSKYQGSEEFQSDMKDFEVRLKKLRAEFNQHLVGVSKSPPSFSIAMIRKIVRRYAGDRSLRGVQRFRYFNLVAKFNTMMEFYNRTIRNREQGRQTTFGYLKNPTETMEIAKENAKNMQPVTPDKGHIMANVNKQQATIKHMFDKWSEFASQTDKSSAQMDFDKFKKIIGYKTTQLIEAKGCKAVRYKITVQDGKIKIQAKPIK